MLSRAVLYYNSLQVRTSPVDLICSQLFSLTGDRLKMFRSLGLKPLARLSSGRCVPQPNLFNPCVGRSFSSTVRQYQNVTDIDEIFKNENQKETERKWSTPLAKQLFAAISVSETTISYSSY
jgi:hypothetical protein